MVRLPASLSLLLFTTACVEDLQSPGVCPDFCPPTRIEVVDTVLTASVVRDSSFRGYLPTHRAKFAQITSGGGTESYGVIRFRQFSDSVYLDTTNTNLRPVVSVDSFAVHLSLRAVSPDSGDFDLSVYHLPASIDSTVTYADLQSTFGDSTELVTMPFTGIGAADTLAMVLPGDAFPTLEADSGVAAVGISIQSQVPTFIDLSTVDYSFTSLWITRYVQVDSADGRLAARTDTTYAGFDTFVFPELTPAGPTALAVGGTPSARAFLGVQLPSFIIDSSSVIRATLLLVPSEPVVGAPGDTIRVLAEALAADIGPKSPVRQAPSDSTEVYSGLVVVGSTETLRIDVTHIIAPWRRDQTSVRAISLRVVREGGTFGEFRFNSSASALGTPAFHITYVPPVVIGY